MSDTKSEPTMASGSSRSADFRDIYSSITRIGVSPVDFSITFSKLVEPAPGLNIVEDQAVVRMSPQQLKSLLDTANKTMVAWEQVYGELTETMKQQSQDRVTEGIRHLKDTLDKANS